MNRRPYIPQRKRVFLGCEGESEQSYGRLLQALIDDRHHRVHIDSILLRPGGGDPLALVELALKKMQHAERRSGPYAVRAILLDRDTFGQAPQRDQRAVAAAGQAKLRLLWQSPCHEAHLLRHLPDYGALRPPTTDLSVAQLAQAWPAYRKGMAAGRLAQILDEPAVTRAAATEPEFSAFLSEIEFGQN